MNQLELHKRIEEFFKAGVESADVTVARDLLLNDDAKRFFFSQADERWLNWLWKEGLLDEVKNKSEDPTRYSYRMPELEYLTRIAEKNPAEVAKIIDSIKISEGNFNPEVVDRFLWVISTLPAEQIKTLTVKIRDERWIYLMRNFNKSGYEFTKTVERLVEKKEAQAILELAQAVLTIKSKEDLAQKSVGSSADHPFYVHDIHASGICEALADIDESYAEKALQITTDIMGDIVKLAGSDEAKVFDFEDSFALYDVDFFTLELDGKRSDSYRADVKNIAAVIKKIVERTIGKKCGDTNQAKSLFKYIDKLPSCRSVWRLRLFTLAQCPEVFKVDLNLALLKVFEVGELYFEIAGGAEYHQALIRCFGVLDPKTEQREYIQKVFDYFGANLEDKDVKKWRKRDGIKILSCIKEHLTSDEKTTAKEKFGISPDDASYVPVPTTSGGRVGMVQHKSPVNLTDFTIDQIIQNLKIDWSPEKLNEQFKNDDFLSPRGVEGLGDALKEDIKKRTNEYLKNINSFFGRSTIHSHYLYSLLRGVEEMLRNKQSLNFEQVGQLFGLFEIIKSDGGQTPFKKKDDKSWLADWVEVHKVIADILLFILENKETKEGVHKAHREQIKNLISYLLTIKDSPSKEHEKPESSEPYHIAINSVRGRAYETFVVFTENDGKALVKDIKEIYKKVLLDDSLAVRFVVGRYLPSFYFRDKEFIVGLFPEIFPKDDLEKKDIYLASWEGYLSNTLYDKLFVELQDYYSHAIALDPKDYTQRKYSKGLDESLAIHIALAFAHLGLEIEDPLFVQFWSMPNVKRHQEFISFIGRSCLTRDQASDQWLSDNKVSKEKLLKFWDWALEHVTEPEALAGFGFWVNPNDEVLDEAVVIEKMAQTLKKSDGDIDWDYGLLRRLPIFAEKNREKTFEIIRHFLLDSKSNLNQNRRVPLFSVNNEIKKALQVVYTEGDKNIKQKVTDLINMLIEKGSSTFWGLKEVISQKYSS